jgi:hypothetical protein
LGAEIGLSKRQILTGDRSRCAGLICIFLSIKVPDLP